MSGKAAAAWLCGIGAVLALLLVTGRIARVAAGAAFAASLVLLGIVSRGFRAPGNR